MGVTDATGVGARLLPVGQRAVAAEWSVMPLTRPRQAELAR